LPDEASELLAHGSWAGDPPDLDYELRSASIADVRERYRARTARRLSAVWASPGNLNA
jgi:hypothetical protein